MKKKQKESLFDRIASDTPSPSYNKNNNSNKNDNDGNNSNNYMDKLRDMIRVQEENEEKNFDKINFSISPKTLKIAAAIIFVGIISIVGIKGYQRYQQKKAESEIIPIEKQISTQMDNIANVEKANIQPSEIVLTIDGVDITYERYQYYLNNVKSSYDYGANEYWFEDMPIRPTDLASSTDTTTVEMAQKKDYLSVEEEAINEISKIVAIEKLAKEKNIEVTDKEVKDYINNYITSIGEESFNATLESNNISRTLYENIVKDILLEDKVLKAQYHDEIYKSINFKDIAHIKHILITYNDEVTTNNDITNEVKDIVNNNTNGNVIKVATLNKETNVYEKQDTASKILNTYKSGETVTINSISDDEEWITITYNNEDAYIKNQNLVINEETVTVSDDQSNNAQIVSSSMDETTSDVKQLSKQEAYELSKSILDKLNGGESFDSLMLQYTEDADMIDNPDGYYIQKSNKNASTIEKEAFALEVGQHSDVIETNFGFSIIYRDSINDSYIDEHILDYATDKIWNKYDIMLQNMTATMNVEKKDSYVPAFINVYVDAYKDYILNSTDEDY